MDIFATKFLATYLLLPVLSVIFIFVGYLIARKNRFLNNKKLIVYLLLSIIILALPGLLGFIDYWFMPYVYIVLQLLYFVVGIYNIRIIRWVLPELEKKSYIWEFLITILVTFGGAAFFSLLFNLVNELQYGLWACTVLLPFCLPTLFFQTYNKYMQIPAEIYDEWQYSEKEDLSSFEQMDYDNLMVLEVELFKKVNDSSPSKIKVKAPDNMIFGTWFNKFLHDYNLKFPLNEIGVNNDELNPYSWIFYVKRSFFHPRRYLDYRLPIIKNKIKEKDVIIAKRVEESLRTPKQIDETSDTNELL